MEFQSLELDVEDILNLHRGWITELYVQDRKTEVEIVELLYERRLLVTLPQIQRCIREWELIQLPAVEHSGPPSPSPTLSDGWELVSAPPKSENIPQAPAAGASYTPSDPVQISEYNKKPLPSLPVPKTPSKSSKIQKRRPSSTTDRLGLTCYHGPTPSDAHEVQAMLKSIPDGIPPIDRFAGDEQAHEKIALGLASHSISPDDELELEDVEKLILRNWRRAADPVRSLQYQEVRSLKRAKTDVKDELNGRENNRSRKRKPQWDEDELESKERKKTPPPSNES